MIKTRLKGGSLSGTYLCTPSAGAPFVRKEVSLTTNREYGFQRWYSQLKRMQRYEILFPGHFPKLVTYGRDGDMAYFDMAYIPDAVTVHDYLIAPRTRAEIDAMFDALMALTGTMYRTQIPSTTAPIELYIYEEIEQKMRACAGNARFQEIATYPAIYFNGHEVPGLASVLPAFRELARANYRNTTETFSHGNLTLENILYQPATATITLIDPYEENVIDSALADYSQILQSCNSKYELYNALTPTIAGARIDLAVPAYAGLEYFRDRFLAFLRERYTPEDVVVIRLLEISQFARMLPFKMELDEDKMVFFYALGSYLFHQLREGVDR
jgi:hypothetical protein